MKKAKGVNEKARQKGSVGKGKKPPGERACDILPYQVTAPRLGSARHHPGVPRRFRCPVIDWLLLLYSIWTGRGSMKLKTGSIKARVCVQSFPGGQLFSVKCVVLSSQRGFVRTVLDRVCRWFLIPNSHLDQSAFSKAHPCPSHGLPIRAVMRSGNDTYCTVQYVGEAMHRLLMPAKEGSVLRRQGNKC